MSGVSSSVGYKTLYDYFYRSINNELTISHRALIKYAIRDGWYLVCFVQQSGHDSVDWYEDCLPPISRECDDYISNVFIGSIQKHISSVLHEFSTTWDNIWHRPECMGFTRSTKSNNVCECCIRHRVLKGCYHRIMYSDTLFHFIDGGFIRRHLQTVGLCADRVRDVELAIASDETYEQLQERWLDRILTEKAKQNAVLLAKKHHLGDRIGRVIASFLGERGSS